MIVSGLTMAPAVTASFPWLLDLFGGFQSARTIHFFTFVALLLFVCVHAGMVVTAGFTRAIVTGLAAASGFLATRDWTRLPPTHGNLLRMGDTQTYAALRALPGGSLAREYSPADISSFPAINTTDPGAVAGSPFAEAYSLLRAGTFADWRVSVEGRVATPRTFSLDELKRLPSRTQITRHVCEEGRSAIAQWTGTPLKLVLEAVGILPTPRFVLFPCYDDWFDSIDMREEPEVPAVHRRDRRVRGRRPEGEHPERVGVAHGDLTPTTPHALAIHCASRAPGTSASPHEGR
jgi:hypothetical protein